MELTGLWMDPAYSPVIQDVVTELTSQDLQWGEQNHPLLSPETSSWARRRLYESMANDWKALNALRVEDGSLAWDGILLEEVYEALAEGDVDKACEELVQTAAVAINAVISLRRQQRKAT